MQHTKQIGLLSGDGIGKEVIQQAKVVLEAIREKHLLSIDIKEGIIGEIAMKHREQVFPVETLDLSLDSDAIILGPTLQTNGNNEAELAIIQTLNAHTRVIPISPIPELSALSPFKDHLQKQVDFTIYESTTMEMDQTLVLALGEIKKDTDMLTLIGEVKDYEAHIIKLELKEDFDYKILSEDEAIEMLIRNPKKINLIVCNPKSSSTIKRIASMIVGSKAVIPSKIVSNRTTIYKPLHNINENLKDGNTANPIGSILSIRLLLQDMGALKAAMSIQEAVDFCMNYGLMTEDLDPVQSFSTTQIGLIIAVYIQEGKQGLKTRKFNDALSTIV